MATDAIERLCTIRLNHNRFNRLLTLAFSAFVCTIGFLFWLNEIPLYERYKTLTGTILMVGAAIFYKIPYFSYLLNRRYFKNSNEDLRLMGNNWRQYYMRIINTAL